MLGSAHTLSKMQADQVLLSARLVVLITGALHACSVRGHAGLQLGPACPQTLIAHYSAFYA